MSSVLPELFEDKPVYVRHLLRSALQVRGLDELYARARENPNEPFSDSLLQALRVELKVSDKDLARVPRAGPVVVVANHPFGLLDGILLDSLLLRIRPDIKILTNRMICHLPELRDRCLPVDVLGEGKETLSSLRRAIKLLREGHGVAFFPAGEVSHWQVKRRCITDPTWNTAAVRCSISTKALIVPVHIEGANGLGFQLAGMVHPRLRTARLPGELMNKRGRDIEIRIGSAIASSELARFDSPEHAMAYVRARSYALEHRPATKTAAVQPGTTATPPKASASAIRFPLLSRIEAVAEQEDGDRIRRAIEGLQAGGGLIVDTPEYAALTMNGGSDPTLLREIGRVRELTFRRVGEGSGKARDIDIFDPYYMHLLLWHKKAGAVAGGYRLAWTQDVLPRRGIGGLYTSTLFRFQPRFFTLLGAAVELGRSFVAPEFQKEFAPLLLLWQGIARCVARRPSAPVLFGPVSISADYPEASRELIVQFVSRHSFRKDLAELAVPRHPFRSRLTSSEDLQMIGTCLDGVESLAAPLTDIAEACGVPVLLRQYLKLGGKVAGFNLDKKFSNALDGLLIVDLRETSPKTLARYMGHDLTAAFLANTCRLQSA